MPRSDRDLLRATERELEHLRDEELLRLTVISRDGDRKSAKQAGKAWETLVTRDIERVRNIVASFRHPKGPGVRVAADDVDAVTHDAYVRLVGIAFKGTAIPQYRSLMRRCVTFQCMDHCRAEMGQDKQRGGSLDEQIHSGEGDPHSRFEGDVARLERERTAEEEQLLAEAERLGDMRGRLTELIAKLDSEKKRRVLEMTFEGRSTEEIMEATGESRDNVYQLRKRGITLIEKMIDGQQDS
jgi:RNA polymerase sigma factor (sigma-70 family)